jgi:hypothetical protein
MQLQEIPVLQINEPSGADMSPKERGFRAKVIEGTINSLTNPLIRITGVKKAAGVKEVTNNTDVTQTLGGI